MYSCSTLGYVKNKWSFSRSVLYYIKLDYTALHCTTLKCLILLEHGALEVSDPGLLPLEETLELQVWLRLVQEHHL